jgi:hypothetical protein
VLAASRTARYIAALVADPDVKPPARELRVVIYERADQTLERAR